MKTNRTNKLNRLLTLGVICANTAPIGFAGVPGNFNFTQGGGQSPQNPAPLNGATQHVPNPQQQLPPTQSKVNPGVTSTSTADPNTPPASLNGIPQGSSPLEKFSGLFDNSPKLDSNGKPVQKPVNVLDAGADSYRKVAEKLNFAEGIITPEQTAALVAGGEGAVPALMEVLNNFGREVYAQASATSTQVTKKGMEGYSAEQRSNIDKAIKMNGLSESLIAKDTRLADPAVAPLVNVVQQQIANKFPQATTQQLESYVVEYFNHAFGGFGGPTPQQQQQQKEAEKPAFNFLEFVTGGAKK